MRLIKYTVRMKTKKRLGEVGEILRALEVCTRAVRSDCCSILMFRIIGLIIGRMKYIVLWVYLARHNNLKT